jgi:hypothetical protein
MGRFISMNELFVQIHIDIAMNGNQGSLARLITRTWLVLIEYDS